MKANGNTPQSDAFAAAARFLGDDGLFRREDEETRRVGLALYRLVADGRPVTAAHLGEAAGLDRDGVQGMLARFPASNIEYDSAGAVVGFRGLSLVPTRHAMAVDGQVLFGWCAFDTLFLPEILDRPVDVASTCPATGADIRLTATPAGIEHPEPAATAMSFVIPEDPDYRAEIRRTFCRFVNFFASREAAAEWAGEAPNTVVLTLDEAHALGHIRNQRAFGAVLTGGR